MADLTPTEELILDVLATRIVRTGEPFWSISRKLTKQLQRLGELGYLHYDSGPVESVWRVWLDDKGVREALMSDYETPHVREIVSLRSHRAEPRHSFGSLPEARQDGELNAFDLCLKILRNEEIR